METIRVGLASDQEKRNWTITASKTAPGNPGPDDKWIDISVEPHIFRRWNGTAWVLIGATGDGGSYITRIGEHIYIGAKEHPWPFTHQSGVVRTVIDAANPNPEYLESNLFLRREEASHRLEITDYNEVTALHARKDHSTYHSFNSEAFNANYVSTANYGEANAKSETTSTKFVTDGAVARRNTETAAGSFASGAARDSAYLRAKLTEVDGAGVVLSETKTLFEVRHDGLYLNGVKYDGFIPSDSHANLKAALLAHNFSGSAYDGSAISHTGLYRGVKHYDAASRALFQHMGNSIWEKIR